jgi:hypothetical protein
MNTLNKNYRVKPLEPVMNYQIEKTAVSAFRKTSTPVAPIYSSPWLALFSHLKAYLNQSSAS